MEITYHAKEENIVELELDGRLVKYRIPPAIGTHSKVFQELSRNDSLKTAQGKQIVAYAHGCLIHKKNEWADQEKVRFPSKNYLRFPAVLTIIPKKSQYGDLEGGMLVDSDLSGKGIEMKTEVPEDLTGWTETQGGILKRENRLFIPYDSWYQEQWSQSNGAVIALATLEGAESLDKIAQDTKRTYKPFWKVDPSKIESTVKKVLVLNGYYVDWLILDCSDNGNDGGGSGVGVLK